MLYDPNGISHHPTRTDINIYKIEGAKLAAEHGKHKNFQYGCSGCLFKVKPIVKLENVIKGLKKSLPLRYHKLIPLNEDAITMGMENVNQIN